MIGVNVSDAEIELNNDYISYAKLVNDINDYEKAIADKRVVMRNLKDRIMSNDGSGRLGISITDHAFSQISSRIEELANDSNAICADVFPGEVRRGLLVPSNLRSFITSMVSQAIEVGSCKEKDSRSGGVEFVYSVTISKWSSDNDLVFVFIVENNAIKTGYFNYVSG